MPKVSVLMSTFNGEKTVAKAIQSILDQTFRDFEFIICDDASTDHTFNIISDYAKKDDRIIVLRNNENLKLSASLNKCIHASKSAYIARMDDDDISYKDRLEKQVCFLDANPQYALLGTRRRNFNESAKWMSSSKNGEVSIENVYKGKAFTHPTIMMRRDGLIDVGMYTDSNRVVRLEDYDLWCKFYAKGYKGYVLPDILLDYYESAESMKKRKYKYRVYGFLSKLEWRKRLDLPLYFNLYAFKGLFVGLIPHRLLLKYKKSRSH